MLVTRSSTQRNRRLTLYTLGAQSLGVDEQQMRTGATILLAIVGIWILTVLSRPINRYKGLVIGAMFIGLVLIFSVPLATEFFQLVDPGEDAAYLLTVVIVATIGGIEIVRFIHRRFVARDTAARTAGLSAGRPRRRGRSGSLAEATTPRE